MGSSESGQGLLRPGDGIRPEPGQGLAGLRGTCPSPARHWPSPVGDPVEGGRDPARRFAVVPGMKKRSMLAIASLATGFVVAAVSPSHALTDTPALGTLDVEDTLSSLDRTVAENNTLELDIDRDGTA